ncbi:MAG: NADH-quinone oxidoreductase subunit NuoN [Gammaproteobacteria bacterium]
MSVQMPDFASALPEIFVLCMACAVLVIDLFLADRNRVVSYMLAQLALLGAILLTVMSPVDGSVVTFAGTFVRDSMSDVLKIFVYVITMVGFVYSRDYLAERGLFKGEFYVLGLFGVLGMMILISASNFITVYLGLELLSLCLYAMVAFDRDSQNASEAAMKYFVLGAIASGMLLYGMSMLYGVTGSLDISQVGSYIAQNGIDNTVLAFGLVFVVVGIAFKLGAVPFHMWLPDVYHGSPTPVTLYLGAAPKIAAFGMAMRLLVDGLQGLHADWQQMLTILSVLSLAIGNVVAIAQTNIKRMLAYSTISHVGFLVLGLLAATADGYAAAMFYTITYAIMATGAFGIVIMLSRAGFEADQLDDYKGLNERSPWFAFMMLVLMFSLAGVPPTVGFYAKLWVIEAVLHVDMVWLAVVAVGFSVVGAFYYLRIVKLMYFDKPVDTAPLRAGVDLRVVVSANGLAILFLGLFPGLLTGVCSLAMH